jgi:hypothetical protein
MVAIIGRKEHMPMASVEEVDTSTRDSSRQVDCSGDGQQGLRSTTKLAAWLAYAVASMPTTWKSYL